MLILAKQVNENMSTHIPQARGRCRRCHYDMVLLGYLREGVMDGMKDT